MMDDLISRKDAAAFLGVSPNSLAVWASTGRHAVPFIKVGRKVYYSKTALSEWLIRRSVTASPGRSGASPMDSQPRTLVARQRARRRVQT